VNSHFGHSRARTSACSSTGALLHRCVPSNISTTTQGAIVSCVELLQSYALCSSDQCETVKSRLPAVCELFWGISGRGDGGLRGIGVSGSGYNEILALEVLNVV